MFYGLIPARPTSPARERYRAVFYLCNLQELKSFFLLNCAEPLMNNVYFELKSRSVPEWESKAEIGLKWKEGTTSVDIKDEKIYSMSTRAELQLKVRVTSNWHHTRRSSLVAVCLHVNCRCVITLFFIVVSFARRGVESARVDANST
ncbi:hypothetical protein EVAR_14623_1 [Eumeta japonica]|uniref:Uncharacterized protein n=1 Tax=Eumeta variegata TaxID=151549 RepID=A0A4C1U2U3_EUMVA|nr:hypothetical protein EVAR_14623_1 [Eumeta japonica]